MRVKTQCRGKASFSVGRRDVTLDFAMLFCQGLGVEFPGLNGMVLTDPVSPVPGEDYNSFRARYWMAESFSKLDVDLGIDRKQKAYHSFYEAESRCRDANCRLTDYFTRCRPEPFRRWMREARRRLHWLLGGITPAQVLERASWGPGATFELPRSRGSHQHKWEFATHTTRGNLVWIEDLWHYAALPEREFRIVETNRVTTVPKNAKTDRTIAMEPAWNAFIQAGLGRVIRHRLQMRCGLLHPTAQETNKDLARIGSSGGRLATIDLKGASDSVSLALCELLLPRDLFKIILSTRSPKGLIEGEVVEYEKVSSMGNGFTFELETALFWALCSSVSGGASVYGDDIVVGSDFAGPVIDFLREAGFEVNEKKTFTEGPFRESCGGHFFNGANVTPPYVRSPLDSLPRYISVANRLAACVTGNGYRDASFEEGWQLLAKPVPRFLWGPQDVGDSVLHMPFDAVKPKWNAHMQVFEGKLLSLSYPQTRAPQWGALQSALHGDIRVEDFPNRKARKVVSIGKWYRPRWSESYPWL